MTLETLLAEEFQSLGIEEINRFSIVSYLNLLRLKDQPTYEHSLRVGLLSSAIAKEIISIEPKALFYPGLLHDVGKLLVDLTVLKKKKDFNEKDMEHMRNHAMFSYNLLRGIHEFSAQVALRHHYFQKKGYPHKLPKLPDNLSKATEATINYYARILSLVDSYDAASTRANNKFGEECRYQTPDEVRDFMFKNNPDQKRLLDHLYSEKIFGERNQTTSKPEDLLISLEGINKKAVIRAEVI